MSYTTQNPYNQRILSTYTSLDEFQLKEVIQRSATGQQQWKLSSFKHRATLVLRLASALTKHKDKAALLMANEMGKPFNQGISEVEKCVWCCEHYAEKASQYLADTPIDISEGSAKKIYQPLGVLLGVMPWNFPFWQVIRFAVPALMGGNTVLLKHAPNVYGCADLLTEIFRSAGFDNTLFSNLNIKTALVQEVIEHRSVSGLTLTGSVAAGMAVGAIAGKAIKPMVLELGGSNPFIVFPDADLDSAVEAALMKMQNAGQSCIAPKRFIIHKDIHDAFVQNLLAGLRDFAPSNPKYRHCNMGPLARLDLAEKLETQVNQSIAQGANPTLSFIRNKTSVWPCVITNVSSEMTAFKEELFGPVYAIASFQTKNQAFTMANQSEFGLGASVFTRDTSIINEAILTLNEGAVFINSMVKSDPRLPFGGIKKSGVGRELGIEGIRAFQNVKTISISN